MLISESCFFTTEKSKFPRSGFPRAMNSISLESGKTSQGTRPLSIKLNAQQSNRLFWLKSSQTAKCSNYLGDSIGQQSSKPESLAT